MAFSAKALSWPESASIVENMALELPLGMGSTCSQPGIAVDILVENQVEGNLGPANNEGGEL